ncbi:hypothetical protein D9M70_479780 [compost metagenome]
MEALVEGGRELADGSLQLFFEEAAAQVQIHDRIVGAGTQALTEACAFLVERGVERGEDMIEAAGDRLLADAETFVQVTRAGDQRLVELACAVVQCRVQPFGAGVERGGARFELAEQVVAALRQRLAQLVEPGIEFGAEAKAGRRQPGKQRIRAG